MEIFKHEDMNIGWFVGDFPSAAFRTKAFEVCQRTHPRGEKWEAHYHKEATEINLLIRGKMKVNDIELNSGDIFILSPYEVASNITYIEDCEMVIIKTPSIPTDKFEAED